jgi:uncharacterized protein DUF6183
MNTELVERGDLDELTRHIDRLCAAADWDALVDLRDRCRRALERGKQLWPAAAHAEYRLALEAPAAWAGAMVVPGAGRFALGPLTEVVASTHSWAELRPNLEPGPLAALTAHERVIRGEDLSADDSIDTRVLELPLVLQPWEPSYPLATYEAEKADFPDVTPPTLAPVEVTPASSRIDDPEACRALVELVTPWTSESDGRAEAVAVAGDACDAIGALGRDRARLGAVSADHALAAMAWAAASGGGHGRRRGMAPGRFAAWWAVVALTGRLDDWPLPARDVGAAAASLRWYRWDTGTPDTGWALRVAIEDPADGLAWALSATDPA